MHKRVIAIVFFIAYSAILIKVMVLKDVPLISIGTLMLNFGGTATGPANFMPFKTIANYLNSKGLIIAGINLIGNIVLLLPIGFLAPLAHKSLTWKKALLLALGAGLAIEALQAVLRVGIFDIDDVILNAIGVAIGYGIFMLLAWIARSMKPATRTVAAIVAAIVIIGAVLYAWQKLPIRIGAAVREGQAGNFNTEGGDLCGGTGGTGQIVSKGNDTITIRRGDGVNQAIPLTGKTVIKTSAGSAPQSDLKIGDRVTVVIDDSETASLVLVCTAPQLKKNN
ncbi:MAG: VanZ family protein [Patescibacteria group bacterium]